MKSLFLSLLVLSFATVASATTPIYGWKSTELSEADASAAVVEGVRSVVEDQNSCSLEKIWGLEAINHLVDMYGNPVIVVYATAQATGANCSLDQYLDCRTSFHKVNGAWTSVDTSCEAEEVGE